MKLKFYKNLAYVRFLIFNISKFKLYFSQVKVVYLLVVVYYFYNHLYIDLYTEVDQ